MEVVGVDKSPLLYMLSFTLHLYLPQCGSNPHCLRLSFWNLHFHSVSLYWTLGIYDVLLSVQRWMRHSPGPQSAYSLLGAQRSAKEWRSLWPSTESALTACGDEAGFSKDFMAGGWEEEDEDIPGRKKKKSWIHTAVKDSHCGVEGTLGCVPHFPKKIFQPAVLCEHPLKSRGPRCLFTELLDLPSSCKIT